MAQRALQQTGLLVCSSARNTGSPAAERGRYRTTLNMAVDYELIEATDGGAIAEAVAGLYRD